jgi:hypothetical protein
VATHCGREASAARATRRPRTRDFVEGSNTPGMAGLAAKHCDSEVTVRRAWQGQWPSNAPRKASGHALTGNRRANKSDRTSEYE